MNDPEDIQPQATYPETGKIYTFNGIPLEPFTVCRDDLYTRLTFDPISEREAAGLFVFVCTQKKERCVMVRGETQEARFRVECAEWLESIGWMTNAALRAEALRIRAEVMEDIAKVMSVEPKAPPPIAGANLPPMPTPGNG